MGKTTVAAGLAQLAAEHGKRVLVCEVDAKGDVTSLLRGPAHRLHAAEIAPGVWSHVDGHRGVAARVPQAAAAHPRGGPDRAAGQGLRLRGHGGAGCPGDPHRGQAVLGGPRVATTTWSSSTPRPAATSSGSWPRPRPSTTWSRSASSASQTDWMLDILSDPRPDRAGRRVHARGDAGQRDDRAGRPGRARRPRCSCRPWSSTACCPSSSAGARRRSSSSCGTPERRARARRSGSGGDAGPVLEAARLAVTMRRTRSTHLAAAPGRARPTGCPCSTCPYLFTRSFGAAHDPPGGRRPRARSWAVTAGRPAGRPAKTPSAQLLAAKEIVIACGPGGVGKTTTAAALGRHGRRRAGRQGAGAHRRPGAAGWPTPWA